MLTRMELPAGQQAARMEQMVRLVEVEGLKELRLEQVLVEVMIPVIGRVTIAPLRMLNLQMFARFVTKDDATDHLLINATSLTWNPCSQTGLFQYTKDCRLQVYEDCLLSWR